MSLPTSVPLCFGAEDIARNEIDLLLIPFAGAGASLYRDWPRSAAGLRVGALQLPGRENRIRETSPLSLVSLARGIAADLSTIDVEHVVVGGHCMGGLLAYQIAVELERVGRHMKALVMSGVQIPENGLYGAFDLTMSDVSIIDEMNASLREANKQPVPERFAPLACRVLRSDVAMLSTYIGDGVVADTPSLVINWSTDPHVLQRHTSQWADRAATTVKILEGAPEQFVGSPGPAIAALTAFLESAVLANHERLG